MPLRATERMPPPPTTCVRPVHAQAGFKKARRLRRGSTVIEGLLAKADTELAALAAHAARVDAIVADGAANAAARDSALVALIGEVRSSSRDDVPHKDLSSQPLRGNRWLPSLIGELAALKASPIVVADLAAAPKGKTRRPLPPHQQQQPRVKGGGSWSGRTFTSPGGIPIFVGRNRRENEGLSLVRRAAC